jgi:large subunit ribosomal protein L29
MSKRAEAIRALREMNETELGDHLRQERRRLFELRFQQATGQVENHRQIREIRREIARTMTVQIELEKGIVHLAPQPRPAPVVAAPASTRRRRKAEPAVAAEPVAAAEPAAVAEQPEDAPAEEPAEVEQEAAVEDTSLSETEPSPEEVDPDE